MVKFVVLGPVGVSFEGVPVPVHRAQRRAVLAFLLLHANRTVTATELIDALWGAEPPATARTQVFAAVSAIRRALRSVGDDPVASVHGGYQLAATVDELDLLAFDEFVGRAQWHAGRGEPDEAVAAARDALGLWNGRALGGVNGAYVEPARASLDDRRLTVLEQLFEWELDRGNHDGVLAELTDAAAAAPFRERLAGCLMVALYRSGRPAEALAVYRRVHRLLVAELGIEPGPVLTELHQCILGNDETLRVPAAARERLAAPKRWFLPRDIPDFTGREAELAQLDKLTGAAADLLVLSAVGVGGIGKTALAVHWAHRVAERFPDGQLYLNLRGYEERPPLPPIEALSALLGALGVPPERVPTDVDGASALFRATLAGQRVLVVLDNARSADQIRPLLPGSSTALVLVTSRDALGGLIARDGARRLDVGLLPRPDAIDLLTRILGPDRIAAEPGAAADLVAVCGQLPLALRIAAAHLAVRPGQSIAGYVAEAAGSRLESLAIEGDPQSNLRAVFDQSYRSLTEEQQRGLRLLGLLPGVDVTVDAAAELMAYDPARTHAIMRALADASLVVEHRPGRFTLHDLTREYANDRAGAPALAAERAAALQRLTAWIVDGAESAVAVLHPANVRLPRSGSPLRFAEADAAQAWLTAELQNVIAVVESGTALGCSDAAWRLAFACRLFFNGRLDRATALSMGRAALAAAADTGDLRARAAAELVMARAYTADGHDVRCGPHAQRCVDLARQAGWPDVEVDAHNSLSVHYLLVGDLRRAADHARLAFDQSIAMGVVPPQFLGKLGLIMLMMGRLAEAADYFERTLESSNHQAGFSRGITLLNLAEVRRQQGRSADEEQLLDDAIKHLTDAGAAHVLTLARADKAVASYHAGRHQEAWRLLAEARADLANSADALARSQVSMRHAEVLLAAGRGHDAIEELRSELDGARAFGLQHPATQVLIALAQAYLDHDPEQAAALATEAAATARNGQFRLLEGQALTAFAAAQRQLGRYAEAQAAAKEALLIHEETGHEPGREQTAALLTLLEPVQPSGR